MSKLTPFRIEGRITIVDLVGINAPEVWALPVITHNRIPVDPSFDLLFRESNWQHFWVPGTIEPEVGNKEKCSWLSVLIETGYTKSTIEEEFKRYWSKETIDWFSGLESIKNIEMSRDKS